MDSQQKLTIICQLIKYIISTLLAVVSILISKEVIEQFQSKATSFKQYEEEITENESITVVISFWPLKSTNYSADVPYQVREQWQLNTDFNLAFGIAEYKSITDKVSLREPNADYSINHNSVGKVKFEKLISRWGDRYKISANLVNVKQPYEAFLQVEISKNIPDHKIPEVLMVFSSEANSYGALTSDWLEGDTVYMHKIKGFNIIQIQPQKVIRLSSPKCNSVSYYGCLSTKLVRADFSHCPRRCAAITIIPEDMPICTSEEEYKCGYEVVRKIHNDNSSNRCLPSCTKIDMKQLGVAYSDDQEGTNAKRNIFFDFSFQNSIMKVEEEFLIHDFVAMLSSIGGTLGMCIGFSFVGLSSFVLGHVQNSIEKFLGKRSNFEIGAMDRKVIKVENILKHSEEIERSNQVEITID